GRRFLGGEPDGRGPHHPRPRRLLHPRQPRGGHDPAGLCRRDGGVPGHGGRVPRALRRLFRPRVRPWRRRRCRIARRARGPLPRGALRSGTRAGCRSPDLRTHGRTAGAALWGWHRLELPGPGAEAVETLPRGLTAAGRGAQRPNLRRIRRVWRARRWIARASPAAGPLPPAPARRSARAFGPPVAWSMALFTPCRT